MSARHWALGVGPDGYTLIGFRERHEMMTWCAGNLRDRREVVVIMPPNKGGATKIYSGISAMNLSEFEPLLDAVQEPGEVIRYVLPWT